MRRQSPAGPTSRVLHLRAAMARRVTGRIDNQNLTIAGFGQIELALRSPARTLRERLRDAARIEDCALICTWLCADNGVVNASLDCSERVLVAFVAPQKIVLGQPKFDGVADAVRVQQQAGLDFLALIVARARKKMHDALLLIDKVRVRSKRVWALPQDRHAQDAQLPIMGEHDSHLVSDSLGLVGLA